MRLRRPILGWGKWAAAVLALLLLIGAFLSRGGKESGVARAPETVSFDTQSRGSGSENKEPEALSVLQNQTSSGKPLNNQETDAVSQVSPPGLDNLTPEARRRTVVGRRQLATQLQGQTADKLATRLESLLRGSAEQPTRAEEEMALMTALSQALRAHGGDSNDAAYAQLSAMLQDKTLSSAARATVAHSLGSSQTPKAVELLLEAYQHASEDVLRGTLMREIARTGDIRWAAQFHEELSPPLEATWSVVGADPQLARAVADGLAKVGAPQGISLLIGELLSSGQPVESLYDLKEPQALAAFLALEKVRNPNAIRVLSNGLLDPNSTEVQQYVSGLSLASMGNVSATQILLQWAAAASDQEAVWAQQWFGKLRDTASFDLITAALARADITNFKSETVRNAVALGLENRIK